MSSRTLIREKIWQQVNILAIPSVPLAAAGARRAPSLQCRPFAFQLYPVREYAYNTLKLSGYDRRVSKVQRHGAICFAPRTCRQLFKSSLVHQNHRLQGGANVHHDTTEEHESYRGQLLGKSIVGQVDTEQVIPSTPASVQIKPVAAQVSHLMRHLEGPPNLKHYSLMLLANVEQETGSAAEVARLLQEMTEEGIQPDTIVQHDALKVLAVHPDALLRGQILEEMRNRWHSLSDVGFHDVAAGLLREGQLELALEFIDDMRRAQLHVQAWLYDMALFMLCDSLELDEALALMQQRMEHPKSAIDDAAWFHLFDVACERSHMKAISYIWHRRVEALYLNPSTGQCMQVLNAAASNGDVYLATRVFERLRRRNAMFTSIHYEMLMQAYGYNEDLKGILGVTKSMDAARIPLHPRALEWLSNCLAGSPTRPKIGVDLLEKLSYKGKVATPIFNCLIKASVAHGNLAEAIEIYKQLHRICVDGANVETFNTLFRGCRKKGEKDTAMFFAAEMLTLKIQPNALTYDRLILVCLQERDNEDALRYYAEMREEGFQPRAGTWLMMVQKLADEGDERAWDLLGTMKKLGLDTEPADRQLRMRWRVKGDEGEREAARI